MDMKSGLLGVAVAVGALAVFPMASLAHSVVEQNSIRSLHDRKAQHKERLVQVPSGMAQTIKELITSPVWQPDFTIVLTSARNRFRLTVSMEKELKTISVLDIRSGMVAGEWRVGPAMPDGDVDRVAMAVLSRMGFKAAQIGNKSCNHK